ncbi:MAG TPA: GNAT family N-acetyltransferase [Pyrinomonadaceae bacterium]|nr:GNAT family N-acetyltransferase [Pyrinomonadaceae bacterium]
MTNGTPHRIRELEPGDLEELFRLRSLLWDQVPAGDHQNEVLDILRHSDTEQIFVAEGENGNLAGFLEVSIRPFVEDCETENVGYLEGWFVDEAHRRQGIGRDLVRSAEIWARSKGCTEMASDVEFGNSISLSAHKELGYGETSRLVHLKKSL